MINRKLTLATKRFFLTILLCVSILYCIGTNSFSDTLPQTALLIDPNTTTWTEISCVLPDCGTFINGTVDWQPAVTGKGYISVYSTSHSGVWNGWVGLGVGAITSGTAQIQTFTGSSTSFLDISTVGRRDMILACVYIRSTSTRKGGSNKLAGTFTVSLWGANTNQPASVAQSMSLESDNPDNPIISTTGKKEEFIIYEFLFITPYTDYFKIYNLQLKYGVSAKVHATTPTEVQIDKVRLFTHRAH